MMESSFTFLRVRGIPIGAHWTWLVVFGLVTWSLGGGLFPSQYPGHSDAAYLAMGLVTAVLFFVSILLHELGHAFRALREGMRIEGITLWLFGGVARFSGTFPSPGAELRIAVAGPAVSVALAAGFGAATALARLVGPSPAGGVLDYLARINLILVGFNMVPALPLDGGRVLRAWLWHRQGSFTAATASAARAGRAFGTLLIGLGALTIFSGPPAGGIWFVFIGWFLIQAAQAEAAAAMVRAAFAGRPVRDFMTPDPATVPPDMPLQALVDEVVRTRGHSTYPVVGEEGLAGLVSVRAAGGVPPEQRAAIRVSEVMLRNPPVLRPDQPMAEALEVLRHPPGRAVVVEDGRVVGILSASDAAKALELQQLFGPPPAPAPRRAGLAVWAVVGTAMALAAGFLYRPPYAVIRPGQAIDVTGDVRITGVPTHPVHGRYLLTPVQLSQPTAIGVAMAALREDRRVVPLATVIPRGTEPGRFFEGQRDLFRESQTLAAAAAARAVGLPVSLEGTGARVVGLVAGSPASRVLRRGDVIVQVDASPVRTVSDLQDAIRSRPVGTAFRLTVQRGAAVRSVRVTSARLPGAPEGAAAIGVYVETRDLRVQLPFEISFRSRQVGGPSAGLAYALLVADLLSPDDEAQGRRIAATGTIDPEGRIGPVGGVEQKALAAREAGVALFVVPADEVDEARLAGLQVRGARTLEEALAALRARA